MKILLGILFIGIALSGRSQTTEASDFSADRPGMATPPSIVQLKSIQIESGFSFEKIISGIAFQENIL